MKTLAFFGYSGYNLIKIINFKKERGRTMKRVLSVFLAALLCLLPVSVCAYAVTDATPDDVCYVTLPKSYAYTVEPCKGYDLYVKKGDSFCFKVIPADGYGLDMALVYYYPTDVTNTTTSDRILRSFFCSRRNPDNSRRKS